MKNVEIVNEFGAEVFENGRFIHSGSRDVRRISGSRSDAAKSIQPLTSPPRGCDRERADTFGAVAFPSVTFLIWFVIFGLFLGTKFLWIECLCLLIYPELLGIYLGIISSVSDENLCQLTTMNWNICVYPLCQRRHFEVLWLKFNWLQHVCWSPWLYCPSWGCWLSITFLTCPSMPWWVSLAAAGPNAPIVSWQFYFGLERSLRVTIYWFVPRSVSGFLSCVFRLSVSLRACDAVWSFFSLRVRFWNGVRPSLMFTLAVFCDCLTGNVLDWWLRQHCLCSGDYYIANGKADEKKFVRPNKQANKLLRLLLVPDVK